MSQLCLFSIWAEGSIEDGKVEWHKMFMWAHNTQQSELVHMEDDGVTWSEMLQIQLNEPKHIASVHHAQTSLQKNI